MATSQSGQLECCRVVTIERDVNKFPPNILVFCILGHICFSKTQSPLIIGAKMVLISAYGNVSAVCPCWKLDLEGRRSCWIYILPFLFLLRYLRIGCRTYFFSLILFYSRCSINLLH